MLDILIIFLSYIICGILVRKNQFDREGNPKFGGGYTKYGDKHYPFGHIGASHQGMEAYRPNEYHHYHPDCYNQRAREADIRWVALGGGRKPIYTPDGKNLLMDRDKIYLDEK